MAPLNIYKASAGSGKTFALTLSYMKLLYTYPEAYRHILAVTFTNKAAGEMKQRILKRLHALSRAEEGRELEDLRILQQETGMEAGEIIRKSGEILRRILNDYSAFSVGTIDKFFQSVIRAFTREIGIQPAYNLELDHPRILAEAVDQLFRNLGEDPGLHTWMSAYIRSRLDEAMSWNVRKEVEELGMHLFREDFQELYSGAALELLSREHLEQFRSEIKEAAESCGQELRQVGTRALGLLEENGLEAGDLKGGRYSPAQVFVLAADEGKARFTDGQRKALREAERWTKKSDPPALEFLVRERLMPLMEEVYQLERIQNTVRILQSNFYTLGILGDISQRVLQIVRENNLFLLADSSRFLRGIIQDNPVPFIYEKTGLRYQHIMLDEFQDTSVFQYDNFRPLLDNALAGGNENLVVGDVKQSIYRWRNSDWMILAGQLEKDFAHQDLDQLPLSRNYRSRENIVRFNNTVFQLAPGQLSRLTGMEGDALFSAYGSVVQQLSGGDGQAGGYVRMEFFPKEEKRNFREQVLDHIPCWIDEVLDSGLRPGDIAILVRRRREGVEVARKLLEHARQTGQYDRYRLISSESLLIGQNSSVSLLLAAMRYLVYPSDRVNLALLKFRCWRQGHEEEAPDAGLLFSEGSGMDVLPAGFLKKQEALRQMPLYELSEALLVIFGMTDSSDDLPYIQAFQDYIIEYQRREAPGILHFLDTWDLQGKGKGVRISEHANAIRILTIHRAKGLEFKAVLLPFINWEITTDQRHSNILWCSSQGTPFSSVPTLPVRFSSSLEHTLFSENYKEEKMKGFLDSLNLLYVALTRAEDMLYMGIPDAEDDTLNSVGDLLASLLPLQAKEQPCLESLASFREGKVLEIGEKPRFEQESAKEDEWQLEQHAMDPERVGLHLRIRAEPVLASASGELSGRAYGELMHRLLSEIKISEEVEEVVDRHVLRGWIPESIAGGLVEKVRRMLETPGVGQWFEKREGRRVFNERELLTGEGKVLRPDRVVIDGRAATVLEYKFGAREESRHHVQTRAYMQQMKALNYEPVAAYLWYVEAGHLEKVEEK